MERFCATITLLRCFLAARPADHFGSDYRTLSPVGRAFISIIVFSNFSASGLIFTAPYKQISAARQLRPRRSYISSTLVRGKGLAHSVSSSLLSQVATPNTEHCVQSCIQVKYPLIALNTYPSLQWSQSLESRPRKLLQSTVQNNMWYSLFTRCLFTSMLLLSSPFSDAKLHFISFQPTLLPNVEKYEVRIHPSRRNSTL